MWQDPFKQIFLMVETKLTALFFQALIEHAVHCNEEKWSTLDIVA